MKEGHQVHWPIMLFCYSYKCGQKVQLVWSRKGTTTLRGQYLSHNQSSGCKTAEAKCQGKLLIVSQVDKTTLKWQHSSQNQLAGGKPTLAKGQHTTEPRKWQPVLHINISSAHEYP